MAAHVMMAAHVVMQCRVRPGAPPHGSAHLLGHQLLVQRLAEPLVQRPALQQRSRAWRSFVQRCEPDGRR